VRDTLLKRPFFQRHFVVSFEPVLDKYATNLAIGKPIHRIDLGSHHQRGLMLPFAVGPTEGMLSLRVSDTDGCSSLLNLTGARRGCNRAQELRRVPAVTLHTVLGWLPEGADVDFLKVDIQGMDVPAILSAGDRLRSIRRMQFEVPMDVHLQEGVRGCQPSVDAIAAFGFRLATAAEVGEYAPLAGAYGSPLIYAGGKVQCSTRGVGEADVFLVRT
jgi:FkbM family methyltransferase